MQMRSLSAVPVRSILEGKFTTIAFPNPFVLPLPPRLWYVTWSQPDDFSPPLSLYLFFLLCCFVNEPKQPEHKELLSARAPVPLPQSYVQ